MPATSHGSAKLETNGTDLLWKARDEFPERGGLGFDLGTNLRLDETPPAPVPVPEWEKLPLYEVGTIPPPIVTKVLSLGLPPVRPDDGIVPRMPPLPENPSSRPLSENTSTPASPAARFFSSILWIGAAIFLLWFFMNTNVIARLIAALILGGAALWVRRSKSSKPIAIAAQPAPLPVPVANPGPKKMFDPNLTDVAMKLSHAHFEAQRLNYANSFKSPDWGVEWSPATRKAMGLTFGSAQSGKGVSTIIPALLTYGGPMFTLDVKGELAAVTAERRRQMGCKVDILDPFGEVNRVYGERGGWTENITKYNPLSVLDPKAETFADDTAAMGEAIILDKKGGENASFFNGAARQLSVGLLAAIVLQRDDERLPPEKRGPGTFREFRRLVSLDIEKFAAVCKGICLAFPNTLAATKLERFSIANKANDGVLFTAWEQTGFLDSEQLLSWMEPKPGEPVFTFDSLTKKHPDAEGKLTATQTVFMVVPPTHIETHSPLLRLMTMQSMRSVLRARYQGYLPVLFLLDEAGTAIGHLSVVEQAYGLTAGLGVTVWSFYQNLGQLKRDYPHSFETFIGNSSMVQIIAARDQETCEYFSKYLGNSTEHTEAETESRSNSSSSGYSTGSSSGSSASEHGGSYNSGMNSGMSSNSSDSTSTTKSRSPMGRPLKYPDEIRNMDPRNLLICFPSDKQYEVKKIAYYRDPRYAGLFRPDPTKPGFVKPASVAAPTPVAANDNGEIILSTAEENKADFDNYWGIGDKFMAADDQFWNDVIAHLRALPDDEAREMMLDRYNERTRESLRTLLEQQAAPVAQARA